jgi:hypothetical protein
LKIKIVTLIALCIPLTLYAQDSIVTKIQQTKIGIGGEFGGVTLGPHIMYYHDRWLATFSYGFSSSNSSHGVIEELDHSLMFRGAYSFASCGEPQSFWPIYLGAAYTIAAEKNKVLGFSGNGTITGISILLGTRALQHNTEFLSGFGAHFELGYSIWNYSHSILSANGRSSEYNYSKFFFSAGAYYYIK